MRVCDAYRTMTIEHQRLSSFGYSSSDKFKARSAHGRTGRRTAGQGRAGHDGAGHGRARFFKHTITKQSLNIIILILENLFYEMFSSSKNCWIIIVLKSKCFKRFHNSYNRKNVTVPKMLRWTSYNNQISIDHSDLLSYVTLLGWHAQIEKCNQVFFRPMSVEVVPSRSLTEAVRDESLVFLLVCATRQK